MSLTITLAPDHTKFLVEDAPGHHLTLPISEGSLHIMKRLLLAQKAAALADIRDPIAEGQLAHWHRHGIGSAVMPTQQEVDHNLHHNPRFPKEHCPFCRDLVRRTLRAKKEALTEDDLLEMLG